MALAQEGLLHRFADAVAPFLKTSSPSGNAVRLAGDVEEKLAEVFDQAKPSFFVQANTLEQKIESGALHFDRAKIKSGALHFENQIGGNALR